MKTTVIKPNKKRAERIIAIFKEMADRRKMIENHLAKGGKLSELNLK